MKWGLVLILSFFWVGAALAQDEPALETEIVDTRTEAISKTLRCVVCQNQSIYDSNAPLAEDMRRLVRKRVEAGDSDDQVRDYLRDRYGDYVLMTPPFQLNTVFLWIGPLILFGLGALWYVLRLHRTPQNAAPELSDADRARVAAALNGEDA
ncbi:MAG: cytochrome c-type biogenesis protein [Pseudomonadota bacterium]